MNMELILRRGIYTLLFMVPFVPLIFLSGYFFPFITGKNFVFRFLVEVAFFAWIILAVIYPAYRPKKSWILISYSIFFIVLILSTLASVDPYYSFWSNFERMEGLVTHLHLFAYFLVLISIFKSEKLWNWFFATSIGASILVGLYAIGQFSGKVKIFQSGDRLESTLGNSAYLAVYLLFHIFIVGYYLARNEIKNIYVKRALWAVLIFETTILFLTETRGAVIGLFAGFFVVAFINAGWGSGIAKKAGIGFLLVLLVVGGSFFALRDSTFVEEQRGLRRFSNLSLESRDVEARFTIWEMALEGAKEKPILGWGLENFAVVFNKYYEPSLYDREPWFDRAHNVFLDWLTTAGILGLLAYLSLFASAVFYLLFDKTKKISFASRSVLVGLLTAYFVQNIFVFDNVTSYILFFAVLGYIHYLHEDSLWEKFKNKLEGLKNIFKDNSLGQIQWGVVPIALLLFVVSFNYFVYQPSRVAKDLIPAIASVTARQNPEKSLELFEGIIERDTFGNKEAREQLLRVSVTASQISGVSEQVRVQFLEFASSQADKQIQEHPFDTRTRLFLGSFYNLFGSHDRALIYLNEAQALSPKKQQIFIERGIAHLRKGDLETAEEIFKTAYNLEKRNRDVAVSYAEILLRQNKTEQAEMVLIEALGEEEARRLLNSIAQ